MSSDFTSDFTNLYFDGYLPGEPGLLASLLSDQDAICE